MSELQYFLCPFLCRFSHLGAVMSKDFPKSWNKDGAAVVFAVARAVLINSFKYRGTYFNPPMFRAIVLTGHFLTHLQKVFCLNDQLHRKHLVSLGLL